jgi:hypothetical protein
MQWRRRRVAQELGRLEAAELAGVLAYARLWGHWRRRWWWIQEGEGPFDAVWMIGGLY